MCSPHFPYLTLQMGPRLVLMAWYRSWCAHAVPRPKRKVIPILGLILTRFPAWSSCVEHVSTVVLLPHMQEFLSDKRKMFVFQEFQGAVGFFFSNVRVSEARVSYCSSPRDLVARYIPSSTSVLGRMGWVEGPGLG